MKEGRVIRPYGSAERGESSGVTTSTSEPPLPAGRKSLSNPSCAEKLNRIPIQSATPNCGAKVVHFDPGLEQAGAQPGHQARDRRDEPLRGGFSVGGIPGGGK